MMPAAPATDLELVRGLHARDRKALARIYGEHHAGIYNLCARILGDREEAQDVTQEVFLKALAAPPAATGDVKLRPWLYRVATNACFNVIRGRRKRDDTDVETMPAVADPYEQAQSVVLIEGSLAALNERYRAALVLKDLHGLAGDELADVLEVSRPAADVLVHRARTAFRRAFAGLAGDDAVAPANLALALPALAVPAALQALPVPPGTLAQGAGPAAGALAKLAAALTSKAAVVAAGAAMVAGGGIAAVKIADHSITPAPAATAGPALGTGSTGVHDTVYHPLDAFGGDHAAAGAHDASHHAASGHEAGHHSASSGHHAESGGHATETHHSSTATHDATGHSSSGSSSQSTTSPTTSGHDGGTGGTDHSGSGSGEPAHGGD